MRQSILSTKIRELRQNARYTQADVSRKLNIQRQTYCNYENSTRTPPIEIIVALAELYHVSVDYLVRDDIAPSAPTDRVSRTAAGKSCSSGASAGAPLPPLESRVLGELSSLPKNAQKEVLHFIQFKKLFPE